MTFASFAIYDAVKFDDVDCYRHSDIIGRRIAWNATLVISGIFGVAAGAAPTFVIFCAMIACIGFGVGGNLPVDGALFLEFLPGSHQYLLTLMSLFWAIGQVVARSVLFIYYLRVVTDALAAV